MHEPVLSWVRLRSSGSPRAPRKTQTPTSWPHEVREAIAVPPSLGAAHNPPTTSFQKAGTTRAAAQVCRVSRQAWNCWSLDRAQNYPLHTGLWPECVYTSGTPLGDPCIVFFFIQLGTAGHYRVTAGKEGRYKPCSAKSYANQNRRQRERERGGEREGRERTRSRKC